MLVFTEVKLHNQSNHPLFLLNVLTNAKLADGIHSSYAACRWITIVCFWRIRTYRFRTRLLFRRWNLIQGKRWRGRLFRHFG